MEEPSQVWPVNQDAGTVIESPVEPLPESQRDYGPLTGQSADVRQQNLSIRQCSACDGSHEEIKVTEYSRPAGPFTHWFMCPTTLDPVNLSLLALRSGEGLELNGALCQFLATAQIAGRYCVAVCWIDQDNKIQVAKSSWRFPTGDYFQTKDADGTEHLGFLGSLKKLLEQEVGQSQPAVMQPANVPKPLRTLMGLANPESRQTIKLPSSPVQNSLGDRVSEAMKSCVPVPD